MPHAQHEEETAATSAAPVTVVTESLEKPSLDDRDYRVVRLPNGLEALLVHDSDTDKASAALDVNVGNFSDETDIPGMAHAVEHVSRRGKPWIEFPCFVFLLTGDTTSFYLWEPRNSQLRMNMANI